MDISHILDQLNEPQRQAVTSESNSVLVIAGAGSGKTRVLVHRIVWAVQMLGISPYSILAVTFTNKAAGEMRSRIEEKLSIPVKGMWVGTFHGIAHRLLRAHYQQAGLPRTFQLIDSDDQLRIVKRLMRDNQIDESRWPAKTFQWYINGKKDEGLRSKNLEAYNDKNEQQNIRVYALYEAVCEQNSLLDFAELLLRAHELFLQNPDLLRIYQHRFRHILVDEFQDTNSIQYAWLRLLVGERNQFFVVGDDDQSIYGWRGAKVENIQRLQVEYPGIELIRLEQNYRSTGNILRAANGLIENNADRLGKNLWTAGEEGDPIKFYRAYNERDEARFVVERIGAWVAEGNLRQDFAVLYRSNAQSRVLEEALLMENIPYRIYGGMRFFDRAEIKDALAYLRLMSNNFDDYAFERIVNTPPRGIGDKTVSVIRANALQENISYWSAMEIIIEAQAIPSRALKALSAFQQLVSSLTELVEQPLHEILENTITQSGLLEYFQKEKGEKGKSRVENLQELVSAAKQFEELDETDLAEDPEFEDLDTLSVFLAYCALESGDSQNDPHGDNVQLMTLHSAKGLEFPSVAIVGMEEGLFPGHQSINEPGRLAEERRLCYVGMTRAEQQLFITCAEHRRLYGRESYPQVSRFIREIPNDVMVEVRPSSAITQPVSVTPARPDTSSSTGFNVGQMVKHDKFGEGILVAHEGSGHHARVQVNFNQVGTKWLVLSYANLTII